MSANDTSIRNRDPDNLTGWPKSIDWLLGNPNEKCICGHERQQHSKIMGINGRGECVAFSCYARCHCNSFKAFTGMENI